MGPEMFQIRDAVKHYKNNKSNRSVRARFISGYLSRPNDAWESLRKNIRHMQQAIATICATGKSREVDIAGRFYTIRYFEILVPNLEIRRL